MANPLSRVDLGQWPTPLQELTRLRKALGGPSIWIKRDDLTGLATGGNKTRKLEYLIADALEQGAQTVITTGAAQSNHCRQTAAAAARYGLGCVVVLRGLAPRETQGNLLLDQLLGARIRWTGDRDSYDVMLETADQEAAAGRQPYVIPAGGSNAIGASAYVEAMDELTRQALALGIGFDSIVVASSSAGTQAGLVVGARALHYQGQILGISISSRKEPLAQRVEELALLTAEYLHLRVEIAHDSVTVDDSYLGGGYGVVGDAEREAIELLASTEGILLGPVYTARAMAGLIDLIRQGEYAQDERVLFWHTGGTAALFAYAADLLSPVRR
jgi:D-cysteine desulfhydrase